MMSPIGLYLAEFAPPAARHPSRSALPPGAGLLEHTDNHDRGDPEHARLEQARSEGLVEGRAAAEAEHAGRVADLECRHAEHLAAERLRWADQQGTVLAERLEGGLAELEARLADAMVVILQPFLDRAVRTRLAEELKQAIEGLLANGTSPAVQVLGPADLVEPLRLAYEGRGGVSVVTAETPDVTVLAGDTRIRSQLGAWASRLGRAGGEER